ncbi:MAG: ABC transporter permease [Erysipelotrichales bacterium]|nr:MAG: ABC transporter permease [Erysipelotrichales bacterium]
MSKEGNTMRKKENWLAKAFQKLFKNKLATIVFFVLVIEIVIVIFAKYIVPYDPLETNIAIKLAPGFWASESPKYVAGHLLGTDHLGRDVLSRLIMGGQISLSVGFTATTIGLLFGVTLGLLAGYYKKLDNVIMRFMDLLFTFPGILLAMLIVAMMGVSTLNATIAISIWSIPGFARMVRGKVLSIKEEDYILAVRSIGASNRRILFSHILSNSMPVIIVIATMRLASSIMSIATLSFLGLGSPPPAPEWGAMIASAREYMWQAPSLIIIPGIVVMITVISFNIVGDKLRDILDPSLKENN